MEVVVRRIVACELLSAEEGGLSRGGWQVILQMWAGVTQQAANWGSWCEVCRCVHFVHFHVTCSSWVQFSAFTCRLLMNLHIIECEICIMLKSFPGILIIFVADPTGLISLRFPVFHVSLPTACARGLPLFITPFIHVLSFKAWCRWGSLPKAFSELDRLNVFCIGTYFHIICPFPESVSCRWHRTWLSKRGKKATK